MVGGRRYLAHEGEVELAMAQERVVLEELVELAHLEGDHQVRVPLLDLPVLLLPRRQLLPALERDLDRAALLRRVGAGSTRSARYEDSYLLCSFLS